MGVSPGLSKSWTRLLFERSGLGTIWVGVALLVVAVLAFAVQELALDRFARSSDQVLDDVRLTVTHLTITVYLVTAYVFCEQSRDQGIAELWPLLDPERARPLLETRARDQAFLTGFGIGGIAIAVVVALFFSPGAADYDPRTWEPENGWHRVCSLLMGYWTSRLSALIVLESGRLSELAGTLRGIDLLELEPLSAFGRRGLLNALLVIGSVAVYSLFLVDVGYLDFFIGLLIVTALVGGTALWLPLRGARARIQQAKSEELSWCRERLRTARAQLAEGTVRPGDLQELVAWEGRIAGVHEWPVDASTFSRFALYLLIPLGSWAGGALVERLVDALLD